MALATAFASLGSSLSYAQTSTWSAAAGGGWNTAANWGGSLPLNNNNLVFDGATWTSGTITNTFTAGAFTAGNITISNFARDWTFGSSNSFNLSGNFSSTGNSGNRTHTFNTSISLNSGTHDFQIVNGASSTTTVLFQGGSVISGNGSINKTGNGTMSLGGGNANTYSGLTTVTAGTLTLNKTAGVNAIAGDVRLAGGTITWAASNQIADTSTVTVAANTTIGTLNTARTETVGAIAYDGTGSLTIASGENGLTATSVNTTGYTGVGNAIILGGNNGGVVTTLSIGSGGLTMSGQTIQLNGGTAVGALGNRLVLGGNFTGSGTNSITRDTAAQAAGGVNQLDLGSAERTFNITSGTTSIANNGSGNLTVVGAGGINKTGAGTLTLGTANTYTGLTTVSQGTLNLNATTGNAIVGDVRLAGGTLSWGASNQISDTSTLTVAATAAIGNGELPAGRTETVGALAFAGNATLTIGSGSNGLTAASVNTAGAGTTAMIVGGNNVSNVTVFTVGSGGLTMSGQTIQLNGGTAVGALGNRFVLGGNFTGSGSNSITRDLVAQAAGGLNQLDLGSAVRTFTIASGTTSITNNGVGTLSVVGAGGGIDKTGNGTLVLGTSNTYSGGTSVSGGTLLVNNSSGSGTGSGGVTVGSGTTLGGNGTISGDVGLTAATIGSAGNALTLGGNLTTAGASNVAASSTVNVGGTTTVSSGALTINGALGVNGAIAGSGAVVVGSTGSLTGNATIANATTISGGTFGSSGNTLTLGSTLGATGDNSIASNVTVNVAGTTTISSGVFTVNGTLGGAGGKIVGSTATLGGSGTLSGDITVQTGGFLTPGNSPGSLVVGDNLYLAGTVTIELGGTAFTLNGTEDYDRIKLSGATATLDLSGSTLNVAQWNSFVPVPGDKFGIFQMESGATISSTLGGFAEGATVATIGGQVIKITYVADFGDSGAIALTGGNDIALYTPIPEPSAYAALVGFGATALALYRRRRRV